MTRLCQRVRKLEAHGAECATGTSWTKMFAEVEHLALNKFPPADRDVIQGMMSRRCASPGIDYPAAIWEGWEVAFADAVSELGCPVAISAADMLL